MAHHVFVRTVGPNGVNRCTFDGRDVSPEDSVEVMYRARLMDDPIGTAELEWIEFNGVRYTDATYTIKVEQG